MYNKKDLFEIQSFISHSNVRLDWKIECDALSHPAIETLAYIISKQFKHSRIISIPIGGDFLAQLLSQYQREPYTSTLIVDDVLTTGKSMTEMKSTILRVNPNEEIFGVVIFCRNLSACPDWVKPFMSLNELFTGIA